MTLTWKHKNRSYLTFGIDTNQFCPTYNKTNNVSELRAYPFSVRYRKTSPRSHTLFSKNYKTEQAGVEIMFAENSAIRQQRMWLWLSKAIKTAEDCTTFDKSWTSCGGNGVCQYNRVHFITFEHVRS